MEGVGKGYVGESFERALVDSVFWLSYPIIGQASTIIKSTLSTQRSIIWILVLTQRPFLLVSLPPVVEYSYLSTL